MMSIGEGARRAAIEQIKLLGTNNIRIRKVDFAADPDQAAETASPGLTYHDACEIGEKLPTCSGWSPLKFVEEPVQLGGREPKATKVVGVSESYDDLTSSRPGQGRFVTYLDVSTAARVCMLGAAVKRELFGVQDAIGKSIKIGEENFQVIGVMGAKNLHDGKASVIKLRDINRDVYIPISTALKRFTDPDYPDGVDEITVQIRQSSLVVPSSAVIKRILERSHLGVKDYEVLIPDELLAQSQRTQRIFNIVMGSIAALSLLVGGIGIMNIMLATVTERTKEIGIRRALGASERDILGQFLNETVLISASGGVIGILLGGLMALAINLFAHWDTVLSPSSILISFGISGSVGVLFGLYPARQAARKDPILALRFE